MPLLRYADTRKWIVNVDIHSLKEAIYFVNTFSDSYGLKVNKENLMPFELVLIWIVMNSNGQKGWLHIIIWIYRGADVEDA